MLEQSIIFQKGMGFAKKPLQGHEYLEKARKKFLPTSPTLAGDWPLMCPFGQTQSTLSIFQATPPMLQL